MKHTVTTLLLAAALLLTACSNRESGMVNGASFGSIIGGAIGGILGGPRGENVGTLVGVVAGGAAGHAMGAQNENRRARPRQVAREVTQEERKAPEHNNLNKERARVRPGYTIESPAEQVFTQTIAHRGEWRSEGSTQNSRASLERALALGIWGTEIDVWLTTDGHVMVNHDATYEGISLQDTTYAACKRLRLSNGEKMPELRDLLKILRRSDSPTLLVLEVKKHSTPERSRACAQAAVAAVQKAGVLDRTVYISFSIEACQMIHQLLPDAQVAYLSGDREPVELYRMGINGIDYNIKHLRQHPEWVEAAHRLNMSVNVWTVDKPDDIREMQRLGVDFITTNEPERCEQLLRQ